MPDTDHRFATPLANLATLAGDDGWLRALGPRHHAMFRPAGETLIVEFEGIGRLMNREGNRPWSLEMARKRGWSVLTIISHGRTWYRDAEVIEFFDELTDDGFFDDFENVVFLGSDVRGYAAAAYSVAAPGSTVFLVSPLATLDRDITPWETRFRSDRKLSFGPRYGYAPGMLDAAGKVFVISDPTETLDSMHASLFRGPHVTHLRAPHGGVNLAGRLENMGILGRLVAGAEAGNLTPLRWAQLWRARHRNPGWLNVMMRKVCDRKRPWLQAVFCGAMLDATGSPAARRRLNDALSQLEAMGRAAPEGRRPTAPPERERMLLAGE